MKILITGGAGFLGSHLVDAALARGDRVVVFDHRLRGKCLSDATLARVETVEGDIFDQAAVERAAQECAVIFHCAALVGVQAYANQPARTMDTEETGLRHVCRAALAVPGCKVVYASSSAVYGHAGGAVGLDEDMEVAPVSNYGVAKRFNEMYLRAQHAETGLESISLRIFNVYGPRQDERLVIPRFIRAALTGEPITLFGDGSQTRDFVYVGDVVQAALACADRVSGCEVVNVASGVETSVRAMAQAIVTQTGSASAILCREIASDRAAFEVERSFGSRDKLLRLAGGAPVTALEQGLAATIASVCPGVPGGSAP